jgi:hypothetical protein
MSSEEQAEAYMEEARLTFQSARTIMETAVETEDMWAQVVKNAYDAIEQAVSGAIASRGESIPRKHPTKISKFLEIFVVGEDTGSSCFTGFAGVAIRNTLTFAARRLTSP